jgi:hypothetical protein
VNQHCLHFDCSFQLLGRRKRRSGNSSYVLRIVKSAPAEEDFDATKCIAKVGFSCSEATNEPSGSAAQQSIVLSLPFWRRRW